ncbi:accessory gene regulator B family protein [Parablautia muri]|nr:accessory gene regulator B family protein [Parablautia muri]
MNEFLKEQYQFSDYQIAQLAFTFKSIGSELSKLLIMGIIFHNDLGRYVFAVAVMMLLRTATGGLHCKKYITCFLVTFSYMFLALMVLPLFEINKVFQLIFLFICMLGNYYIGPVTSKVHRPLNEKCTKRVKVQAFVIIFFYLTLTYIVPENPYVTVGFWVIILNTLQLVTAKILKKKGEFHYEGETCENF